MDYLLDEEMLGTPNAEEGGGEAYAIPGSCSGEPKAVA